MNEKLINYLPPVLHNVKELQAITDAQQLEIENAWNSLQLVMDNQFIETATEQGVSAWEKELCITPFSTDTLDTRKQRIKMMWKKGAIYTYNLLVKWLKEAADESSFAQLKDYVLSVNLPFKSDYETIFSALSNILPANIFIDKKLVLSEKNTFNAAIAKRCLAKITVPSSNIREEIDEISFLTDENGYALIDENADVLIL